MVPDISHERYWKSPERQLGVSNGQSPNLAFFSPVAAPVEHSSVARPRNPLRLRMLFLSPHLLSFPQDVISQASESAWESGMPTKLACKSTDPRPSASLAFDQIPSFLLFHSPHLLSSPRDARRKMFDVE